MTVVYVIAVILVMIVLFNLKAPGKRIEHEIVATEAITSDSVMRSIGQLLGPPLVGGNQIKALNNGDEIFPAMLKAIASAQKTITFETFIYWSGDVGKAFAKALCERASSGVKVHVLLDWIGSKELEASAIEEMKSCGVLVKKYRPLRWYTLMRFNNRTHRKILVVDGVLGFTGGVGIADQWQGHAQDLEHWRDTHFQVEGPVVAQLQAAFNDNWNATHPAVLHGEPYFPALEERGPVKAQVFKSSPEEGSSSARLMYLFSIAHARETILIANSYFVPDSHFRKVMKDAIRRGVRIEVLVPGKHIDTIVTRKASRALWGDMLEAGVKIYEYQPTMFHCKYMIVDTAWVSVGSTNLDNRSFRLNDECNLNAIDAEWARAMIEVFEKDKKSCKEVTLADWQNRPLLEKIEENIAWIVRSQV